MNLEMRVYIDDGQAEIWTHQSIVEFDETDGWIHFEEETNFLLPAGWGMRVEVFQIPSSDDVEVSNFSAQFFYQCGDISPLVELQIEEA